MLTKCQFTTISTQFTIVVHDVTTPISRKCLVYNYRNSTYDSCERTLCN